MESAPTALQIMVAVLSVTVAGVVGAGAIHRGRRPGRWPLYVSAAGAVAFVAGVVGQRVFPTADEISRLSRAGAQITPPSPFEAGVEIPWIAVHLTPVSLAGVLAAVIGVSLVLVFEVGPGEDPVDRRPDPGCGDLDAV